MMIRTFGLPSGIPLSARSWVAVTWPYRLTVLLSVDIEMEVRAQMERTLIRPAPDRPRFADAPLPGVTAAATTAVFATGEGPGVTALATTAVSRPGGR